MANKWKIEANTICGQKMYTVYRAKDEMIPDYSGNRIYMCGYYATKEEAQRIADNANAKKWNDNPELLEAAEQ